MMLQIDSVQRCNVGSKKRHIEGLHVYLYDPEFLVQHECYIALLFVTVGNIDIQLLATWIFRCLTNPKHKLLNPEVYCKIRDSQKKLYIYTSFISPT